MVSDRRQLGPPLTQVDKNDYTGRKNGGFPSVFLPIILNGLRRKRLVVHNICGSSSMGS